MVKNFVIIGVGGYVAPKHLKAIKDHNHNLIAALDPNDSVGVLDSYFPNAFFFTELERLDRYIEKIKSQGTVVDYFVICSPNYLHDAHIRFGLKHGADVICEKPLVLNPWNITSLSSIEKETAKKVYAILQMRLHPEVELIKEKIKKFSSENRGKLTLTYVAPRGHWYHASWKGDPSKSGGIVTNIGIHMFDLLQSLFGSVRESYVYVNNYSRAVGSLRFGIVDVDWFLSIEANLPLDSYPMINNSVRCIEIGDKVFSFSKAFSDLHFDSYREIFDGNGFTIEDALPSIEIVHSINNSELCEVKENSTHPLTLLPQKNHPFV